MKIQLQFRLARKWCSQQYQTINIHKHFQTDTIVGQLANKDNVGNMITDDQRYLSFKNVQSTPQYYHIMMFDLLAKVRKYGSCTFFWFVLLQSLNELI